MLDAAGSSPLDSLDPRAQSFVPPVGVPAMYKTISSRALQSRDVYNIQPKLRASC